MRRGFTLIELLVVLAILTLLLTATPRFLAGMASLRLHSAADDLVATLRDLHAVAIREQTTTDFALDPATRSYRLSTVAGAKPLPAIVTRVSLSGVDSSLVPGESTTRILFYPDGSASGGVIRLKLGNVSASIAVDWLTGRVRRDD